MSSDRKFETRRRKLGRLGWILLVLLALLLCIIGGLVFFFVQQRPESEILVARVCALSTPASRPTMEVAVTLYNKDGHPIFTHSPYPVAGNQVELQGNVISYGVGVTYQLTSLQGNFRDPRLEKLYAPPPISLSRGEDSIYPYISKIPTVTPSSDFLMVQADGHSYDIYVTANGLSAIRVNGPLACGLSNHQATG